MISKNTMPLSTGNPGGGGGVGGGGSPGAATHTAIGVIMNAKSVKNLIGTIFIGCKSK